MKTFKLSSLRAAALLAAGFSSVVFYAEVASAFVILGLGNKCADISGGGVIANGTPVVLFALEETTNNGALALMAPSVTLQVVNA